MGAFQSTPLSSEVIVNIMTNRVDNQKAVLGNYQIEKWGMIAIDKIQITDDCVGSLQCCYSYQLLALSKVSKTPNLTEMKQV